jgi:S-adenosylmethionine:tRNA-ribosyltransferase-isomerase (queuine synthetase)
MSDNIEVVINNREKFTGRLIGLITDEECRAVMNTEDAGRKIFSAESVSVHKLESVTSKKRFVVATSNYSTDERREIFISPTIRYMSIRFGRKTFKCEDENDYTLTEL